MKNTISLLKTDSFGILTLADSDIERAKKAAKEFDIPWPFDGAYLTTTHYALLTAAYLARTGWKPEDPLLVKARKIAAWVCREPPASGNGRTGSQSAVVERMAKEIEAGGLDDHKAVRAALTALRSVQPPAHA